MEKDLARKMYEKHYAHQNTSNSIGTHDHRSCYSLRLITHEQVTNINGPIMRLYTKHFDYTTNLLMTITSLLH